MCVQTPQVFPLQFPNFGNLDPSLPSFNVSVARQLYQSAKEFFPLANININANGNFVPCTGCIEVSVACKCNSFMPAIHVTSVVELVLFACNCAITGAICRDSALSPRGTRHLGQAAATNQPTRAPLPSGMGSPWVSADIQWDTPWGGHLHIFPRCACEWVGARVLRAYSGIIYLDCTRCVTCYGMYV